MINTPVEMRCFTRIVLQEKTILYGSAQRQVYETSQQRATSGLSGFN